MNLVRTHKKKTSKPIEGNGLRSINNKGSIDYLRYGHELKNRKDRFLYSLEDKSKISGTTVLKTEIPQVAKDEDVYKFIAFIENNKIVAVVTNDYNNLYKHPIKFNRRYYPGEAEYVLFSILWKIPEDLIWDYLPTALIWIDLMGLWQTMFDPKVFGDPWKENLYCLTTGRRLSKKGDLFSIEKTSDFENYNFERLVLPTKRVNKSTLKAEPGVMVFRRIVDYVLNSHRYKSSSDATQLLDLVTEEINKIPLDANPNEGYAPSKLGEKQKKFLAKNLNVMLRKQIIMLDAGLGVEKVNDMSHFSVNFFMLYNLFNSSHWNLEGKFDIEKFIFSAPKIKKAIFDLLKKQDAKFFKANFDKPLLLYSKRSNDNNILKTNFFVKIDRIFRTQSSSAFH